MAIRTGAEVTAAARAARTRAKRDRWIAELSAAGWSVVQAGHIRVGATYAQDPSVYVYCDRCTVEIADLMHSEVPLPAVLAAVNGHTCQEVAS